MTRVSFKGSYTAHMPFATLAVFIGCLHIASSEVCPSDEEVCEIWLEVTEKLTMVTSTGDLVIPAKGGLFKFDRDDPGLTGDPVDASTIIQADGYWEDQRLVFSVNGSVPGPIIEVFEDQLLRIHVLNKLHSESITVHWHGIHQRGSSYMDGVGYISQCPIAPGDRFTYEYFAYPRGTHWYHAHTGAQRSNGIYGGLVVHRRGEGTAEAKEHVAVLSDWNHHWDSNEAHIRSIYGVFLGRAEYFPTHTVDGLGYSNFPFHSGLINNHGRFWINETSNNGAPLEVFNVTKGDEYRFRVINAGTLYPFRVSVDSHVLTMVASDSAELLPVKVESFVINVGERFDFKLTATEEVGNYWVRVETLEIDSEFPHHTEAVLHYEGATLTTDYDADTPERSRECTENTPCVVMNCPFRYFPESENTECIGFESITGNNTSTGEDNVRGLNPEEYEEKFLNFHFTALGPSVNGIKWVTPSQPVYAQRVNVDLCTREEIPINESAQCTHRLLLKHNITYQFVLTNSGVGPAHPIHMHGHLFWVVKLGYGQYNTSSAVLEAQSEDFECDTLDDGTSNCNEVRWTNSSWSTDGVPGLNLVDPPLKDTIIVPSGGYAVIRFVSDNPGLWFMHCHLELHHLDGMALVLDEAPDLHVSVPTNFPLCNGFPNQPKEQTDEMTETEMILYVTIALLVVAIVVIIILSGTVSSLKKRTKYDKI